MIEPKLKKLIEAMAEAERRTISNMGKILLEEAVERRRRPAKRAARIKK
jgi:hypothetical protein